MTFTHSCELPGAPARVFAALTTPSELREWFAEHVEIEPRQGGRFRFWGKRTYATGSSAAADQMLRRYDPERALAFSWRFDGRESDVTIQLEPATGARTRLTLTHRFPEPPRGDDAREVVEDWWRFALGNLDAHLRGGEGIVRQDFSDASPQVRVSILIDAPREQVFKALIDPAALNQWIASAASVDPRPGGHYSYGWQYKVGARDVTGGPTRILDYVENERLVTDWPDWRGDPSNPPTSVAWLLESVGDKTRVTLVHGVFTRTVDIGDYPFGWGQFLSQLKGLVQKQPAQLVP